MFKSGLFALLLLSGPALAEEPHTVKLGVEHMTCAACPITVRKALSRVAGVSATAVDMTAHTVTVSFDPNRTTPESIAATVSDAGFPARVLRDGS